MSLESINAPQEICKMRDSIWHSETQRAKTIYIYAPTKD